MVPRLALSSPTRFFRASVTQQQPYRSFCTTLVALPTCSTAKPLNTASEMWHCQSRVHVHARTHAHTHTHTHIYTHTYTHTHTHTHHKVQCSGPSHFWQHASTHNLNPLLPLSPLIPQIILSMQTCETNNNTQSHQEYSAATCSLLPFWFQTSEHLFWLVGIRPASHLATWTP